MPVRIVGSALLVLGVAIGCSEYDQRGATTPVSPATPVMATSSDCDGSYSRKLPNPYPCKNAADPGANRLAHKYDSTDCTFKIASNTVLYDGFGNARCTVTDAQTRTVDAWWTTYGNRSSTAPYIAYDANGAELGRVSPEFDAAIREAGAVRITWAHLRALLS